jgi:hypothetical protein
MLTLVRINGHDVVGVLVIDQTGQAVGGNCVLIVFFGLEADGILAKGDVSNISAAEILQLEGSVQDTEGVSGFKLDHRYGFLQMTLLTFLRRLLLRREGDVLIAVFKNAYTRRLSNFTT